MPVLADWYRRFRTRGLEIVGITEMSPPAAEVRRVLKARNVTYPVLNDRDGSIIKKYGFESHPDTVVIDRSGKIVHVEQGFVRGDEKAIERAFLPLLAKPGTASSGQRRSP